MHVQKYQHAFQNTEMRARMFQKSAGARNEGGRGWVGEWAGKREKTSRTKRRTFLRKWVCNLPIRARREFI